MHALAPLPSRPRPRALLFLVALAWSTPAQGQPLTLETLVARAVAQNERARVSTAQAEAAASRVKRARAFFFPELSATGNYTRRLHQTVRNVGGSEVVIQRYDAMSAQANLSWVLFDARAFPLYRQAKLESAAAALTAEEDRRLLGYEAADAYLMVLGQQQVAQAAQRRLEFAQTTLRDARARAEAGLVSSNDVTRGELEAATAERELASARAAVETSLVELAYLANMALAPPLAIPEALLTQAAQAAPDPAAIARTGLQQRLDLAAGQNRIGALRASAQEPGRRLIPTLTAVGQYRVTNEGGLSGRNGDGFAGLVAGWALFDGGERRAETAEREALVRAEEAANEARARGVERDVHRAVVALKSAQSAKKVADNAAVIARRNVSETAELYRQGLVGALEVADANLRLFEADVALARENYSLALAYLDLRAAAGEPAPGTRGASR